MAIWPVGEIEVKWTGALSPITLVAATQLTRIGDGFTIVLCGVFSVGVPLCTCLYPTHEKLALQFRAFSCVGPIIIKL